LGIHLEIDKYDKYNINQKLTEPTKWISNTTTVKKPNKFRIRIDRTDTLKALKRSHYTIPTTDEILHRLSNVKKR
jgi:hypothetical protein